MKELSSEGSADLVTVYRYFSQNIRTATSTIVAMMEAVHDGFDDAGEMMGLVAQSGFLLDLFDRSMSVSFRYILEGEIEKRDDEVNIGKLITHLLEKTSVMSEVPDVTLEVDIEDSFLVKNNAYILKSIFLVILYEAVRNSAGNLKIKGVKPVLTVSASDGFTSLPKIMSIFKEILSKADIQLEYNNDVITMRFKHENSDCR